MLAAGSLTSRISILQRSTSVDSIGQPVETWSTLATVWADVRHTGGLEAIKADRDTSIVRASMRVRWRTDVNAGMRVTHAGSAYEIRAVLPDSRRREYVDLVCERVA